MTAPAATDLVTLVSDELSADVALLGAELVRLDDAVGQALLWSGDATWWAGRAPLLFPIVGGLADDTFRHRGRAYTLPRHGFARRSVFTAIERGTAHVTLRLEDSEATRAVWPFAFRLDVTHRLTGTRLETVAEVTNRSDEAMPCAFGFHPAFRWPLPGAGGRSAHTIRFETPETAPIRRLDGRGLVEPTPRPSPVDTAILALDDQLFVEDAVVFDRPASRRLRYGTGEIGLDIVFPDMPHLALWSKPGAPFVCIEPWQGHADPADFTGEIVDKPGMVQLAPGASRRFSMSVELTFGQV